MSCKFVHPVVRILFILSIQYYCSIEAAPPQVPCHFVFGDSLYDDGNNNLLATRAKVNYPPYGIDFPQGPTGRFSNGRNMADAIATLLGFDHYIPPFAKARGREIMQGVNYASGAAGILDQSGLNQGDRVTMNEQLSNHRITITRISAMLRSFSAARDLLGKCLYTVDMGPNDYLNNYLLMTIRPPPEEFADQLIQEYSRQLQYLYEEGARKVAVFGIGLIGCIPRVLATFPRNNGSPCVDFVNNAVSLFNGKLVSLVAAINANLTGAKFTYIDSFGIGAGDPTQLGFKFLNVSCCQVVRGEDLCIRSLPPCCNRSEYVFWDAVHPTEAINVLTAGRAYIALLPTDGVPYDISHLAQL